MPGNSAYRGGNRSRAARGAPQGDAVVSAITVQVIVCVVLLLAAVFVKKVDEARYTQIRGQYDLMVTDPGASGEVLEELSGAGNAMQRAFASIEGWITAIIQRFTGDTGGLADPPESYQPPEEREDEPPLLSEAAPEGEGAADAFDFNYLSYLGGAEVAYTGLGQGGAFPVDTGGGGALAVPAGVTLAQLEIIGKVKPPVTGIITSEFSYRVHPVKGGDDFHNGMDIAAEEGRDILAALPGEVSEVGEDDIYGLYIKVKHAMHLETFYAHCSEIIASEGDAVRQGERIAKVGSTGMVTGPHLHFSVIVNDQYADPYWVLKESIRLVD